MSVLLYLEEQAIVSAEMSAEIERLMNDEQKNLEEALFGVGVTPDTLRTAASEYFQVPVFVMPEGFDIKAEILTYVPEDSALHYSVIPLLLEDGILVVGVNDPDDLQVKEALNFISTKHNLPYKMVFMLLEDIKKALEFYSNLKGEVTDALTSLETELDTEIAKKSKEGDEDDPQESLEHIKEDAPVTKIVATILRYAVDGKASDIHIEPTEVKVVVRFRVDGLLQTSLELPKNVQMAVAARIKILSSMRLDERRKPQDGRFSATFDVVRLISVFQFYLPVMVKKW